MLPLGLYEVLPASRKDRCADARRHTRFRPALGRPRQRRADALLARAARRAHPVRRLSARVQAARGTAGPVFRSGAAKPSDRFDELRPVERVLHRPDREEAAEPLPPGDADPVVRDGGMQPVLPILPKLGHLQVARDRPARRRGEPREARARGQGARLQQHRVHVQRPRRVPRVRDRHGAGVS